MAVAAVLLALVALAAHAVLAVLAVSLARWSFPLRPRAGGRLCAILHLRSRPERLASVLELRDLLLAWSHRCVILAATDGSSWPRLGVPEFLDLSLEEGPTTRRYLRGGELGCLESHRRSWALARRESSVSVVFEDDVRLLPAARELLQAGALEALLGPKGVLHLARAIPNALAKREARVDDLPLLVTPGGGCVVYRASSPNYSSCAYALGARCAEALLEDGRLLPVDDLMSSARDLETLVVKPPLVELLQLGSDT